MSIITPQFQQLIDWCNQPAPAFTGDAHSLFFTLNKDSNHAVYEGFLFFLPGPYPSSPLRNAHFVGTGRLAVTDLSCAAYKATAEPEWVRVSIAISILLNAVVASLEFFDAAAGNAGPGNRKGSVELDVSVNSLPSFFALSGFGNLYVSQTRLIL